MTSETFRRSQNFCLQKLTNLASLATAGSVRPTSVLSPFSVSEAYLVFFSKYSSYGAGCRRHCRTWIRPPRGVPGCGRSRDRRHARYAHGHDPCSFAGSQETREKGQGERLAQVAIGALTVVFSPFYSDNTKAKSIFGCFGLVLTFSY